MKFLPIFFMFLLMLGMHYYVIFRLWQMIPAVTVRVVMLVVTVSAVVSIVLSITAGEAFPSPVTGVMYRMGTAWFFIFLYLLIIFLLLDIVRITHLLPMEKVLHGNWISLSVVCGFIAVVMSYGFFTYQHKEQVELDLPVDNIAFPLKILAISDLHLGYNIGKDEFEQWIDQLNSEEPDIILIAGDIIDNHLLPLQEQHISESFHRLKSTYGIYAAVGNHEYIAGIDKSIAFLQEAGICVLRDSVALVDSTFFVVGRDDRSNRNRLPLETLTHSLDKSKPVILLDHQPVRLEETEANNITLQISGHTHHGQLIPISWITRLMFEKPYGYLKKGNSHIYVTSGIGIWGGKFRIGTQSEYVVIKLH